MGMDIGNVEWKEPWRPVDVEEARLILQELDREIGEHHPLYHLDLSVLAKRMDSDDVLILLRGTTKPLAVVHLTWSGNKEAGGQYPCVEFYDTMYEALENW